MKGVQTFCKKTPFTYLFCNVCPIYRDYSLVTGVLSTINFYHVKNTISKCKFRHKKVKEPKYKENLEVTLLQTTVISRYCFFAKSSLWFTNSTSDGMLDTMLPQSQNPQQCTHTSFLSLSPPFFKQNANRQTIGFYRQTVFLVSQGRYGKPCCSVTTHYYTAP